MKKLFQNLNNGETEICRVASPVPGSNEVLIASQYSLISAGTERMLVDFGKSNLLSKARQQPEKVRMVLNKARTDGLLPTYQAVRSKLDQPIPLGYSNSGVVVAVGPNVTTIKINDRVVSNGSHAELVKVPEILCAKIPDGVSYEDAVFTVVASIGLQGIRLAQPTLGENVAVIGVGLIGLLAVQLLKAQGCRVIAFDFDQHKLDLAHQFGAETYNLSSGTDPVSAAVEFSGGQGIDAVLIAATTKTNDPVTQAARMSRKRGRIVLLGVVGLSINRADFYEKELSFQVSCSYGPGRYDKEYEEKGNDYPIGFVRWTEQRNFEAILALMSEGRLKTEALRSHSFCFEDAGKAYGVLSSEQSVLGIMLRYESKIEERRQDIIELSDHKAVNSSSVFVALVGAGNYASGVLVPALRKSFAHLHTLVSTGGAVSASAPSASSFEYLSSNVGKMLSEQVINTVFVSTRHNTHAELVVASLKAGKNVYVEKPLCLTLDELYAIEEAYENSNSLLMIGFNRRFSPLILKVRELLGNVSAPKSFVVTVNAGHIPDDHWTQDPEVGGGRILGEACHFIDLLRFLAGFSVVEYSISSMDSPTRDTQTINIKFADGSLGVIHYFANGDKTFPKERLEVFSSGRVLQLDNFRKLIGYGWPGFKKMKLSSQDKGQLQCIDSFLTAIRDGKESPIPINEIIEISKISIELAKN
jgi:predicted dehydrogenase